VDAPEQRHRPAWLDASLVPGFRRSSFSPSAAGRFSNSTTAEDSGAASWESSNAGLIIACIKILTETVALVPLAKQFVFHNRAPLII
jgi:hypothetical protein